MSKIPTIDLSKLCLNDNVEESDWVEIANSLKISIEKFGFIYLSNHGVDFEKVTQVFEESVKFFTLPVQDKMKYERDFKTTFHGYTKVGGEKMTLNTILELRETFDVALCNAEKEKCKFPDSEIPKFRVSMEGLIEQSRHLVNILLKLLALALELPLHYFISLHKNIADPSIPNYTQLRTLFYPRIENSALIKPGVVRCAEHTDYGTITLLFQDKVGGLEIKSNGKWVAAVPLENTILMNVGDLLQIWSGGIFPSSVHRVIVPEKEIQHKLPRQSIALFVKPDNDTLIESVVIDKDKEKVADKKNQLESKVYAGEHFLKRTIYHRQIAEVEQG